MPHQCTQCGHTFPDGSKEMLSGCPDCGGNKFQFQPAADARGTAGQNDSPEPPSDPESPTVTDAPSDDESTGNPAQADARREVASRDELAAEVEERASDVTGESTPDSEPDAATDTTSESGEDSDMAALRRELNDQFESIKILEPGQYELNLMELYNREEYIIALREDGQYVIEVPDSWLGGDNSE